MKFSTIWKANVIAFASSFCVMVIELVAARILAPHIGVSLYTWTSIIGVILAGIALGNYIGGKIADKWASPSLLVTILFAGTLATMAILPLSKTTITLNWFIGMHLMLNSMLRVMVIFFLPAIILSMVSPLVIKLTLADVGKTGGVVGTIYAFSTVGAILGTFMTGFFFILWFGTRMTVWLIVVILIVTGILAWFAWNIPQRWKVSIQNIMLLVLAVLIILSAVLLFTFRDSWEQNYTKETNYYTVQITQGSDLDPVTGKDRATKALILDHLVHSIVAPEDPTRLGYSYLKIFAEIIKYRIGDGSTPSMLYLGGGGYCLPRYMEATYHGSANEVVEIDPGVTQIAYQELGLSSDTRIITYNQDARMFFNNRNDLRGRYDFVIGDVYNDMSIPYHLTTVEFDKMVKSSLKPDGIYLINIIDRYYDGKFMPAFINTLNHTFKHLYLFSDKDFIGYENRNTFVILATDSIFNMNRFKEFVANDANVRFGLFIHDEVLLEKYLAKRKPILLTDDYAPTDALVAPLYEKMFETQY